MIRLSAPRNGLIITSIDILGTLKSSTYDYDNNSIIGGKGRWVYAPEISLIGGNTRNDFVVNIYDNLRKRTFSENFNKSLFTYSPSTVAVPIPGVKVEGDFYVEIVPYNLPRLNANSLWDTDYWNRYVVHNWYYQLCLGYEESWNPQSLISQGGAELQDRNVPFNWIIHANGIQP
jgi:hypothetical protein